MIQAIIEGNLGNQLFQYANAKAKSIEWGEELEICIDKRFKNQLINYQIENVQIKEKLKIDFRQRIIMIIFLAIRKFIGGKNQYKRYKIEKIFRKFLNKNGIYIESFDYNKNEKSKTKNKVFLGYFESEKFFNKIEDQLRKEYTPKEDNLIDNEELYKKMKETNSVAISIRRGDFISLGLLVCDNKYFDNAIKKLQEKIDNPTFFIFSDDIDWVKNNMKFPGEVYYDKEENPVWERLRLMSNCKHYIISNSTFSWWGCYLSENRNKIIIAPKKWRVYDELLDTKQQDWILIDC